mgnify:FL=1
MHPEELPLPGLGICPAGQVPVMTTPWSVSVLSTQEMDESEISLLEAATIPRVVSNRVQVSISSGQRRDRYGDELPGVSSCDGCKFLLHSDHAVRENSS